MRLACLALVLCACQTTDDGWDVPDGYARVYGQDFATKGARDEFHFSDEAAWGWHMDRSEDSDVQHFTWLEAERPSKYEPPHRSPLTIALIRNIEVGDFIFELDVKNTAPESRGAHRDLCFFFGFQDPANFYYIHLAPGPDEHAHNIFKVDDAARRRVAEVAATGIDWGTGWHHVRIERVLVSGAIRVFFDDMQTPVIEATDTTHGVGRLGVGTFDDSGCYTNFSIFAPAVEHHQHANPFQQSKAGE